MKERFDIAADLRKIARLLEIKGENPFKTQAYERGASAIENHQGDFDALVKTGRLKEIPGIGTALAAIIDEIYHTGECWMVQQLLRRDAARRDRAKRGSWTKSKKNHRTA